MSYEHLPLGFGIVLICNVCGARAQTASISINGNRIYWAYQGWGRGTDPGKDFKPATEERVIEVVKTLADGSTVVSKRTIKAKPFRPGRPRTTRHDLCTSCNLVDKSAKAERDRIKQARKDRINAQRKARWQTKEET